ASSEDVIAVGEQGTVIVSSDGGDTWLKQPNDTQRLLTAISFRGGSNLWIAGRGGAILKRTRPLSPIRISSPSLPPVLRDATPRKKLAPRLPKNTQNEEEARPVIRP
ncbi:MAG TPA: hypothetical protein VNK26_07705, partial [Pyrinomonadaceae bacterium]|nr:hypothetical protein [Pyrinomonadaceae bacterium]